MQKKTTYYTKYISKDICYYNGYWDNNSIYSMA